MTGEPYLMRLMGFGLVKPKNPLLGMDVARAVTQTGARVTRGGAQPRARPDAARAHRYSECLRQLHGHPFGLTTPFPAEPAAFAVGGAEGYLTAGSYPDDGLGEIFLKFGKQGSTLADAQHRALVKDGYAMMLAPGWYQLENAAIPV